jgi:ubiquinone/menaquinone biosynthesis C-methylase UbiE
MSEPLNPLENHTTYLIRPEDPTETSRLLLVDRLFTRAMGGLFPTNYSPSPGNIVLDIACGPGEWVLAVAHDFPEIDVIGIDISHGMTQWAQGQAKVRGLPNASFQIMNMLEPLIFPDNTFEFVNARCLSFAMHPGDWPRLIKECFRILRPGGILRISDTEWWEYNTPAKEQLASWFLQAMWKDGRTFSAGGRFIGTPMMLRGFLAESGFSAIQEQMFPLSYSYDSQDYDTWFQATIMTYELSAPFLLKMKVTTREEFDRVFKQAEIEGRKPEFRSFAYLLSAWGQKPVQ